MFHYKTGKAEGISVGVDDSKNYRGNTAASIRKSHLRCLDRATYLIQEGKDNDDLATLQYGWGQMDGCNSQPTKEERIIAKNIFLSNRH